jgi:hypothetical protein
MIGILTGKLWGAVAVAGAFLAVLAATFLKGRSKGRTELQDEMQNAYNSTTKDLHNAKESRFDSHPDLVLEQLRKYAKRGNGGSDT